MPSRKLAILLLVAVVAEFGFLCCPCNDPQTLSYSNCEVSVENLDNGGITPEVSKRDTISERSYGLRVTLRRNLGTCMLRRHSLLFTSAYATSCDCLPEFDFETEDSVSQIKIIAMTDLSDEISAGDIVDDAFRVLYRGNYVSTDTFFVGGFAFRVGEASLEEPRSVGNPSYDFVLARALAAPVVAQFRIDVTLESGTVLSTLTDKVLLK